ncbi:MAG: glycosyltransferase family 2 protein [Candidatus Delongbacteria bacterium]
MPKISVIMSVYNDEKNLPAAVESILDQTYSDFEFLITEDCSKDSSLEILRQYAAKDNRIVLIENKENLKLTRNLNNMLTLAKGDLIARMDSDDISLPERFEKQVKIFENDPDVDFVFTSTMLMDKDGNDLCESWRPDDIKKILNHMKYDSYIPHPTVMAKKEIFAEAGNYTEHKGYGQEDKELWEKFIANGVAFHYLNEILLRYRLNPAGISFNVRNYSKEEIYSYKKVNICIDNYNRKRAMEIYFENKNMIPFKYKLFLLIKFLLPNRVRFYKSVLIKIIKG